MIEGVEKVFRKYYGKKLLFVSALFGICAYFVYHSLVAAVGVFVMNTLFAVLGCLGFVPLLGAFLYWVLVKKWLMALLMGWFEIGGTWLTAVVFWWNFVGAVAFCVLTTFIFIVEVFS